MTEVTRERIFFFDVGQGSANLIDLGNDRFAIIDGGSAKESRDAYHSPLSHTLIKNSARYLGTAASEGSAGTPTGPTIEVLAISHWHEDHWKGLERHFLSESIIGELSNIRKIVILDSRDWKEFLRDTNPKLSDIQVFVKQLKQRFRDLKIESATVPPDQPGRVIDIGETDSKLELLHPTPDVADQARESGRLNLGSGLFVFRSGLNQDEFVFSGDAPLTAWDAVRKREGEQHRKREVKVLAVAHHGGASWSHRLASDDHDEIVKWVKEKLETAMRVEYAFISVGTDNSHNHPFEGVVRALVDLNIKVLCSQFTRKCDRERNLSDLGLISLTTFNATTRLSAVEKKLVGMDSIPAASHPNRTTSDSRARHVGCASTVVAVIQKGGTTILRGDGHRSLVSNLKEDGATPMCWRST